MIAFAGIAGSVSLIIGWLVTLRLFRLARETGAAPERLLATGFGGLFCVGYPLAAISRGPGLGETNEGSLIFAIGMLGMMTGIAALSRFPRVVFRPDQSWALVASVSIMALGAVAGVGSIVVVALSRTRAEPVAEMQPWALTLFFAIGLSTGWNALESTLYYRSMKKRMVLGIADAATTHRFLLWAIAGWVSSIQVGAILAIRASGLPILAPLPMSLIAFSSLITALCWWLAFFMPDSYRARLERHAAAL